MIKLQLKTMSSQQSGTGPALLFFPLWSARQQPCFPTTPPPSSPLSSSHIGSWGWMEPWFMLTPVISSFFLVPICHWSEPGDPQHFLSPSFPSLRTVCLWWLPLSSAACSVTSSLPLILTSLILTPQISSFFLQETRPGHQMKQSLPPFFWYPNGCWFSCYFFPL